MSNNNYLKISIVTLVILAAAGIGAFLFQTKKASGPAIQGDLTINPPPLSSQTPTTTLFFAGDIMLSRNVARKIYAANDFNLPFQKIANVTKSADIAFANLESPFNDKGNHSIEGSLVFNADPKSIEGLNFAGFDILSTANNHTLDQGTKGLDYTYKYLAQNGIVPIGTTAACHNGEIITKNNIRFGFLAYSYTALNDGGKSHDPAVCDSNDLTQLKTDIQNLKPRVDYLIVSTHMGIEYTRQPTTAQVNFSHTAVDAGADLVIGNHPHWIQPIEHYISSSPLAGKGERSGWIFYAMGNFVFDQMWSTDTREGLTATITFTDKAVEKIELKPVIIDDFCCPRWANDDETKSILKKLNLTSTSL